MSPSSARGRRVEGILGMSSKERERLRLIQAIREGRRTQQQAAHELGLSVRQVKRLCRAFRRQGARGLVSRRRGRPSNRRIALAEQRRVVQLVERHYPDFGPTLAAEYLSEHHGYSGSVETLRQWMIAAKVWQPRRTPQRRIHQLRERRAAVGELVQIDGSPHAWLEQRAPRCCLIAFVDDASGLLQYARFVAVESTRAYLHALHSYVQQLGRPVAFYSDRHSIFTKHDPEDPEPTQFERAVRALDIEPILALSPQAKGRVERAFQTLQDRLVKALRLARVDSLEAANAFLPGFLVHYNARFSRTPREPADAHRPLHLTAEQLQWACSEQFPRTLSRSLSCQFRGQLYLIDTEGAPAYHLRGARITVCDHSPGHPLVLVHNGKALPWRRFEGPRHLPDRVADDKQLDQFVDAAKRRQSKKSGAHKPSPDHPWLGKLRRRVNKPTCTQPP